MEIKIDREIFYKCISRVQSIIEKRTNMPILSTVLLNAEGNKIHMLATDLELAFEQITDADVIQEGSVAVSGRKLFEILKESKVNDFYIKAKENNRIFLSDKVAKFELAGYSPDEYPVFVEPKGVKFVRVKGKVIHEMINKTIYAVTREDSGFKLLGIFTEKFIKDDSKALRMVATDGHRLSMIDKVVSDIESLDLDKGVMIPKKGMVEVGKMTAEEGEVNIAFKDKTFVVKSDNMVLVVRLLESKFPDYSNFIPETQEYLLKVGRVPLLEAMRKMLILSSERYKAVKLSFSSDTLKLSSTNPDIGEGEEVISVQYKGKDMELGFNPRYFIDILQSMESEEVVLGFIDESKPCILKGIADEGFLGLIMPMRF